MKHWHIKPVKRDTGGAPTTVDIRSKLMGAGHAQAKPGTQFVMPDVVAKKALSDKERLVILRALKLPGADEASMIKEITKLLARLESLKLPVRFETMRRNRKTMRRNRKWKLARRWKIAPAMKL